MSNAQADFDQTVLLVLAYAQQPLSVQDVAHRVWQAASNPAPLTVQQERALLFDVADSLQRVKANKVGPNAYMLPACSLGPINMKTWSVQHEKAQQIPAKAGDCEPDRVCNHWQQSDNNA